MMMIQNGGSGVVMLGGSGDTGDSGTTMVHCCRINKTWQTQHPGDSSGLNELASLAVVRRQPAMR